MSLKKNHSEWLTAQLLKRGVPLGGKTAEAKLEELTERQPDLAKKIKNCWRQFKARSKKTEPTTSITVKKTTRNRIKDQSNRGKITIDEFLNKIMDNTPEIPKIRKPHSKKIETALAGEIITRAIILLAKNNSQSEYRKNRNKVLNPKGLTKYDQIYPLKSYIPTNIEEAIEILDPEEIAQWKMQRTQNTDNSNCKGLERSESCTPHTHSTPTIEPNQDEHKPECTDNEID